MLRLDLFAERVDCEGLDRDTTVAELLEAQALFGRLHPDFCTGCGGLCCSHSEIWVDNVFYRSHAELQDRMLVRDNGEVLLRGDSCPFLQEDGRCGRYRRERMLVCQLFFCDKQAAEYYVRLVQCVLETYHLAVMYENMLSRLGPGIRRQWPLRNACANPVCNRKDYATPLYDILLFLQEYYSRNQEEIPSLPEQEQSRSRMQAQAEAEDLFLTQSVLTHYFSRKSRNSAIYSKART